MKQELLSFKLSLRETSQEQSAGKHNLQKAIYVCYAQEEEIAVVEEALDAHSAQQKDVTLEKTRILAALYPETMDDQEYRTFVKFL